MNVSTSVNISERTILDLIIDMDTKKLIERRYLDFVRDVVEDFPLGSIKDFAQWNEI